MLGLLAGCAPVSAEFDLDLEDAVPRSDRGTVVPEVPEAPVPLTPRCETSATDGVYAGPFGVDVRRVPAGVLSRALPVDAQWLYSVSNDNDLYHHTVVVPALRQGRWYYLRVGDVVWSATAENFGSRRRERRVSFYVPRELADAIACTREVARRDREPLAVPTATVSASERASTRDAIPITLSLTNGAIQPIGIALGSPDQRDRDWRFSLSIRLDGEPVALPTPAGYSGRPFVLGPLATTQVVTELAAWVPVKPGRYEIDVHYDLDLYVPNERYGRPDAATLVYELYHQRWDARVTGSVAIVVED